MPSVLNRIALGLAIAVGVYAAVLGALLTPYLQRFALYAHKINTLFLHDIDSGEQFGFAKNQVTPFNIRTPDGETLYAWHVLPIDVYARNELSLLEEKRPDGMVQDFTTTEAFRLLTSDETVRVVVNSQGWRPDTYRSLTAQPNTHVLTIDYRGFGKSTGSPTEAGLITDGVALVNWVLHVAKIPPEHIVILGQSLGTAVAAAVGLEFANAGNVKKDEDRKQPLLRSYSSDVTHPTTFAGIIVVAPFYDLPSLLLTYRIGGFLPLLLPLRPFPSLARMLTSRVADTWPTAERLAAYYGSFGDHSGARTAMGSLQVMHAVDDGDISFLQTGMICRRMLGAKCVGLESPAVVEVKEEGRPKVRMEILEYGGHNRVVTYSSVAGAVLRAFEGL
ncbi:hypothetical protein LTR37_004404 [Vermiconidia calcicola]|uniref:Uncharacterized protein n=1 Tax=Vermiconidia calcicola TaxID=1690605 RepID=A0ACC3NP66_9PEZI|nr:hypothetical protein LTR37_004404 [Vermiconidia calcicola]